MLLLIYGACYKNWPFATVNCVLISTSILLDKTLEEWGRVLLGDRLFTAAAVKVNLSCKTKKIVPKPKDRLGMFRIIDRYTATFCYLIFLYFIEKNRQSLEITATSN